MANLIVQNLADCGIAVTHTSLPAEELYAPGPDGVLFGRQFDMRLLIGVSCLFRYANFTPADKYQVQARIGSAPTLPD